MGIIPLGVFWRIEFKNVFLDAWVAQSVKHPTLAQVMISGPWVQPHIGSVLTAQSLEPASDSVSPSLSLCPSPAHALSLSLKNKYTLRKQLAQWCEIFFP